MSRRYASPLLVSVFVVLLARGGAQNPSNSSAVAAPKKFDVASIRPSADRTGQPGWMGIRITGDMFEAHSMSLNSLVWYAFAGRGLKPQMVSEGKGWIESQQWDIIAKFDDPSLAGLSNAERNDRIRPMLQALLRERFDLKLHTELRPTSVYALVQAKGGAKVKEVPAPPEVQGDWMEAMKRYREENPGKPFPGAISCSDRCTATAVTISNALGQIQGSSHADRMVVDETGLKGHYDFSFRQPRNEDDDAMAEVMEDLGMKLEPRKVDLTTYVIDSAEKPSPN
ncbi:MAG TPA: TIGR03435 family protein [Acidobacteriaceae bacterium]|nr:TIGR03435 family protein [Acidobacteriaceae bacterium]